MGNWPRLRAFSTACVLLFLTLVATNTSAQVYDWQFELGDNIHPGTVPIPTLSDNSGSSLSSLLAGQLRPAVKIRTPLNTSTANTFFDGTTPLQNIYSGFLNFGAGGDALTATQTENLVFQTNGTASSGASIGQFGLDRYHPDATNPSPSSGLSDTVYDFTGVNTGNPILFPGSPTFRSTASANSTAPNILSSLFTIPIIRLDEVIKNAPTDHEVVPFVSRFNSLGSPLVNSEFEGIAAWETTDQLLSRGDFQALMTHYRMRGADGVIAHDGGVVNYTHEQFLDDTVSGWGFLDQIYAGTIMEIDFSTAGFEQFGLARSGVFGAVPSGQMVATILHSNLNDIDLPIGFKASIDGKTVDQPPIPLIEARSHELFTFWLNGDEWQLLGAGDIFGDDERGGIGIGAPLFVDSLTALGPSPVPLPPAVWLMLTAIAVLSRFGRSKRL